MSLPLPNKSTPRHYTALGRFLGRNKNGHPGASDTSRRWQIHKNLRGQEAWEIYTLAILIALITIAATFQQAAQYIPFDGWHWLWIAPLTLFASFAIIQIIAIASAVVGSILGSCGFMSASPAGSRTSFFFLSSLTAYAAWAATSGSWIAPLGYLWLSLVALNIIASVWLAMREHEHRL
ncbi:MAG: hypothetical protein P8J87_09865 [Verrucomicrobiales bacterium]|nr:hypothetical protein [Verrucomicrobiales bacterium]